jgi:hypothetical protein
MLQLHYIYKSYNGLQLEKHDGLVIKMKPSIYENYKENNVGGYTSKKKERR